MLTPFQVKDKIFQASGRSAYKADDVDRFMEEVGSSYEQMFKENSELIKRVSLLAEKLEQYKKDEDSIKSSVLTAQKAAQKILEDAKQKAEEMTAEADDVLTAAQSEAALVAADAEKSVRSDLSESISEAESKAQEIIADAKKRAGDIMDAAEEKARDRQGAVNRTVTSESIYFDMLKREVSEFRKDLLAKYKAHIEMITALPALAAEEAEKAEKAEEPVQPESPEALAEDTVEEAAAEEATVEETAVEETAVEEAAVEEAAAEEAAVEETAVEETSDEAPDDTCCEACGVSAGFFAADGEGHVEFVTEEQVDELPPFSNTAADSAHEEYVEHADVPFDFSASAELEFVSEGEEPSAEDSEPAADINDFIANFEEPVHGAKPVTTVRKKGFKIDLSLIDDGKSLEEPAAENDAELSSEPLPEEAVPAYSDESSEDAVPPFVEKEESAELKKRFSIIRNSDMPSDDEDDDDDYDDDDGGSPFKGLFKKKK